MKDTIRFKLLIHIGLLPTTYWILLVLVGIILRSLLNIDEISCHLLDVIRVTEFMFYLQ